MNDFSIPLNISLEDLIAMVIKTRAELHLHSSDPHWKEKENLLEFCKYELTELNSDNATMKASLHTGIERLIFEQWLMMRHRARNCRCLGRPK